MSQVYYDTDGNFYYALQSTTGDAPASSPTYWEPLPIPGELKAAIGLAAAAGILEGQDKFDRAQALRAEARADLNRQINAGARRDGLAMSLAVTDRG